MRDHGQYSIHMMNGYECNGTVTFMRWKIECSIQEAKPSWIEQFIFHRLKIYVPSHKWKHSLFVLYNIKHIFCHLERLIVLDILENAISFWSRHFRSKVTEVYHWTLNCTIARLYSTMTSRAFNGISILYHAIQSNDKNLHWCYIIFNNCVTSYCVHEGRF